MHDKPYRARYIPTEPQLCSRRIPAILAFESQYIMHSYDMPPDIGLFLAENTGLGRKT